MKDAKITDEVCVLIKNVTFGNFFYKNPLTR